MIGDGRGSLASDRKVQDAGAALLPGSKSFVFS